MFAKGDGIEGGEARVHLRVAASRIPHARGMECGHHNRRSSAISGFVRYEHVATVIGI